MLTLHNLTAVYATLGCKLNFAETSTLAANLEQMGIRRAQGGESADLCVINTCAVTSVAEGKSRGLIRRLIRRHPNALMVVMGCYAQLSADGLKDIEGVDLVLGAEEKSAATTIIARTLQHSSVKGKSEAYTVPLRKIQSFAPSCSRGNRTRYFLKVQDGCNYFCSYCTIPFARGKSRSPSVESLVSQARRVAEEGGKEIVLTGVNIGHFGYGSEESLLDLVRALDKVDGISRYRISSIEPDLLDDELISFCSESRRFMPHFHLPLQCGSDKVLRLMRRRYDTRLFADKVERIKSLMPHAFIGTDVMVGMRGEDEEAFRESASFIEAIDITQLHVFPYSQRPGTAALSIPHKVSEEEKKHRVQDLIQLSEAKREAFYAKHIGQTMPVLLEHGGGKRTVSGFTDNYIRVCLDPEVAASYKDNEIARLCPTRFNADRSALVVTSPPCPTQSTEA